LDGFNEVRVSTNPNSVRMKEAVRTVAHAIEQRRFKLVLPKYIVNTVRVKKFVLFEQKVFLVLGLQKDLEQMGYTQVITKTIDYHLFDVVIEFHSPTLSRDKLERLEKANAWYKLVIEKSSETERQQLFKIKELQDENEIFKSKVVDCTKCQSLQEKLKELNSINESLTTSVQKLVNSHERGKAKLTQRDEKIFVLQKELQLLEEQSKVFHESNDLLASNDVLRKSLETKFNLLQNDKPLEQTIEIIKKEMGDTVKCFDAEKKVFENEISKVKKVLEQRFKDFDEVNTELSKRTDKFETYYANLEKENALLKSQLASQNYTSSQKENNDLRTSYNELKKEI
nr:outer membrane protein porin [Tanacetum cinerariifolium]